MITRRTLAATLAAPFLPSVLCAAGSESLVFIGTYTRNKSKGIYAFRFDSKTGKLTPVGLAAEVASPSFLTIHWNKKYLYAVSEAVPGQKTGNVASFSIDAASGKLAHMNTVSARGSSSCHLVVDKTGTNLAVANYGDGVTALFPIHADGKLGEASSVMQHKGTGPDSRRQQGPHAHSTTISADNRFVMVCDLGLDQVLVFKLDAANHKLTPNDPPFATVAAGGGPRHFSFHPSGKFAYVNHEMGDAVTAFAYDASRGVFKEINTLSTLPADYAAKDQNHTAHVQVHPSGKFVYCSNRGHNSIALFTIDKKKGSITAVEQFSTQGKTPRNFNIDPSGQYLIAANQDSDNLVVFKIDQKTGRLSPTGQNLEAPMPVCVQFYPLG